MVCSVIELSKQLCVKFLHIDNKLNIAYNYSYDRQLQAIKVDHFSVSSPQGEDSPALESEKDDLSNYLQMLSEVRSADDESNIDHHHCQCTVHLSVKGME